MNFTKVVFGACMALGLAASTGCGYAYPTGSLYMGASIPHGMDRAEMTGAAKTGDKFGEACATGILYIAAFGDASIDAAKKAGGINEVHTVDFRESNILGIYQQGCTQVHGK